ncbi:MAG: hypothetical protein JWO11_3065 [Nocardioides sp.]|nr:hypothetical protein [Nocardioides sp.]
MATAPTSPVILHIGLPKTGTSFLQRVLWENRSVLADHGVHLPYRRRAEMFAAALHVIDKDYGWDPTGYEPDAAWERIRRNVQACEGTTVISSEWLCLAPAERAIQTLSELGRDRVRVVLTVRDLARQLPAEWQEGVKHGRKLSFDAFLKGILGGQGKDALRERFWSAQDPIDVLTRWAADLPPDRVTIVTCPPPGADRTLLWRRFAEVVGIPEGVVTLPVNDVNASLGATQVELLRRVNKRFPRRGQEIVHRAMVKRYFGLDVLGSLSSPKAVVPATWAPVIEDTCAQWIEQLSAAGYRVVGDLQELLPAEILTANEATAPNKDSESAESVLDLSVQATTVLLQEIYRLRAENAQLKRGGSVSVRSRVGSVIRRGRRATTLRRGGLRRGRGQ